MPVVAGTQYATRTDLANLGLVAGALANVTTTTQDAALVAASAVADSYLQSRYQLPLLQWGQDLSRAVAIIAAYDLLTSRGYNPQSSADQNVRQRYLDALAWLDSISKGASTPSYVTDSSTPTGTTDGSTSTETDGAFQMVTSSVRGWTSRGYSSGWGSDTGSGNW